MARIDHTNHAHANTPDARRRCRDARAAMARSAAILAEKVYAGGGDSIDAAEAVMNDRPTIDTPAGLVREGSRIELEVRGGTSEVVTVTTVSDNIKNGRPGLDAMDAHRWAYADQVIRVITF